jgi:hypothetical protein
MSSTTAQRPTTSPASMTALTSVMLLAAVAIGFTLPATAVRGGRLTFGLAAVIVMCAVAELASIDREVDGHNHTLSLSEVSLVVGLALAAPADLVIGRVVAAAIVFGVIKRIPLRKLAFDAALVALETAVAAVVFRALLGGAQPDEPRGWLALAAAVAVCVAVDLIAMRLALAILAAPQRPAMALVAIGSAAASLVIGLVAVIWLAADTQRVAVVLVLAALAWLSVRGMAVAMDRAVSRAG